MGTVIHNLADFESFLEVCNQRPRNGNADWCGTADWAQAEQFARFGDERTESQIARFRSAMTVESSLQSIIATRYADAGDEVDIDRYLSGEPEYMMKYVTETGRGSRIISILVNIGAPALVQAQTLQRRGLATLCVVDALEECGYRVEVTACSSANAGKSNQLLITIPVKRAEDTLDMTRLAYTIANPSMLRRHVFAYYDASPVVRETLGSNGGRADDYASTVLTPDVYISQAELKEFETDASTEAWIEKTIKKFSGAQAGEGE